jgi:hypothetical protein
MMVTIRESHPTGKVANTIRESSHTVKESDQHYYKNTFSLFRGGKSNDLHQKVCVNADLRRLGLCPLGKIKLQRLAP